MAEWIRFWIVAAILFAGIFCYVLEVIGIFRFGYVLNRMHASGIGDTMGLLLIVVALMIASGWNFTTLKLLLLIIFMWLTSPTSTHFLSMVEMRTNPYLDRYVSRRKAS
jgi:multicomponent Na+:H+ antiporter subunit G